MARRRKVIEKTQRYKPTKPRLLREKNVQGPWSTAQCSTVKSTGESCWPRFEVRQCLQEHCNFISFAGFEREGRQHSDQERAGDEGEKVFVSVFVFVSLFVSLFVSGFVSVFVLMR